MHGRQGKVQVHILERQGTEGTLHSKVRQGQKRYAYLLGRYSKEATHLR